MSRPPSFRQDNLAKRPVPDQVTQRFPRLAEGIDPVDAIRVRFHIRSVTSIVVLVPAE